MLTGDGVDLCGDVSVHSLGLDPEAIAPASGRRLDWAVARRRVARRADAGAARNVHKGTFGTLGIVGGADGMVGAPLLAGRAALHAGAGKVWIGFAADERPAVDWGQPELMLRSADEVLGAGADALVCGPGLGGGAAAIALVARAIAGHVPLVLDADALNLIAADPALAAAVAASRGADARHTAPRRGRTPAQYDHRGGPVRSSGSRAGARREAQCGSRRQRRRQRARLS